MARKGVYSRVQVPDNSDLSRIQDAIAKAIETLANDDDDVMSPVTAVSVTSQLQNGSTVVVFKGNASQVVTLSLANSQGAGIGQVAIFENTGMSAVTINAAGGNTINGATSLVVAAGIVVFLASDGATKWLAISGPGGTGGGGGVTIDQVKMHVGLRG